MIKAQKRSTNDQQPKRVLVTTANRRPSGLYGCPENDVELFERHGANLLSMVVFSDDLSSGKQLIAVVLEHHGDEAYVEQPGEGTRKHPTLLTYDVFAIAAIDIIRKLDAAPRIIQRQSHTSLVTRMAAMLERSKQCKQSSWRIQKRHGTRKNSLVIINISTL